MLVSLALLPLAGLVHGAPQITVTVPITKLHTTLTTVLPTTGAVTVNIPGYTTTTITNGGAIVASLYSKYSSYLNAQGTTTSSTKASSTTVPTSTQKPSSSTSKTASSSAASASASAIATGVPYAQYGVTAAQWAALGSAVGGKLYQASPLGRSCYTLTSNGTGGPVGGKTDLLGQCVQDQNGYKNDLYIANQFGGYMETNWGTCQKTGEQCQLHYAAPQDPAAYAPPRTCYQGSTPNWYVDARGPSDVQAALNFSRTTKVPLVIKNSGHDYKGRSSGPNSLGLWVHNLNSAPVGSSNFVAAGCSGPGVPAVTFGAGVNFVTLYTWAENNGVTVVGGSSETVVPGGGWVAGGGHSSISNTLGLGVDRALQIKAVMPDGTYVTASRCQNADIFYALRGGGGSTFGVNIEVTMSTAPKLNLSVAYVRFASTNLDNYKTFISLCIQNGLKWADEGWGGYIEPGAATGQVAGFVLTTPVLNLTAAKASMKPITDYVASLGNLALNNEVASSPSFKSFYDKYLVPNEEVVGIGVALASRLIPKEVFANNASAAALADAFVSGFNVVGTNVATSLTMAYGGAPVQVLVTAPSSYKTDGTSAVNPIWYDTVWHVILGPSFDFSATPAQVADAHNRAQQAANFLRAVAPTSGAYQNEAHFNEPDHEKSFWGYDLVNYNKLVGLKQKYDPNNILTCHQCIGWNPNDARYQCYPPTS